MSSEILSINFFVFQMVFYWSMVPGCSWLCIWPYQCDVICVMRITVISTAAHVGWDVPRISLMVPKSSPATDQPYICGTRLKMSSELTFPWCCLMWFCLFLSLGGALGVLIIKAEVDEGRLKVPSIQDHQLWVVSFTVILRHFQSLVPLAMISPTLLGGSSFLKVGTGFVSLSRVWHVADIQSSPMNKWEAECKASTAF